MITFIYILIAIVAILLVLVVLTQNPKGGGVSQFTGGGTQLMGVKKTGDLLEKLTWGFGIALIVFCLSANLILKPAAKAEPGEEDQEEGQKTEQPQKPQPQKK